MKKEPPKQSMHAASLPSHKPLAGLVSGAVSIEQSRAIEEVRASILVAKSMPRDLAQVFEDIANTCRRRTFAEKAFYAFPRGGQTVTGVSIRFAEELARLYGNVKYGIAEISQHDDYTEYMAYAIDLQTNTMSEQKFTVKHERHTKQGVTKLTDPRDIYELGANNASRRLRQRILAILPPDLIEDAENLCRQTIAGGGNKSMADRVKEMLAAFSPFGVTKKMIEEKLGKPLTSVLPEDLTELLAIFNSLRDGGKASDFFAPKEPEKPDHVQAATAAAAAAQGATPEPAQPAPPTEDDDKV